MIGKGISTKSRKRAAARVEQKARAVARAAAYNRSWVRGCCQACGRPLVLKPSEARHELEIANAHEIVFRSKGGNPNDSRNILNVCGECNVLRFHRRGPERVWLSVVVVDPVLMADAPNGIRIEAWNGKAVTYEETHTEAADTAR